MWQAFSELFEDFLNTDGPSVRRRHQVIEEVWDRLLGGGWSGGGTEGWRVGWRGDPLIQNGFAAGPEANGGSISSLKQAYLKIVAVVIMDRGRVSFF